MGLLISISYNNQPVTYDVTLHQEEVYLLRLAQTQEGGNENYLPEKMMIRKKAKYGSVIWKITLSLLENSRMKFQILTRRNYLHEQNSDCHSRGSRT